MEYVILVAIAFFIVAYCDNRKNRNKRIQEFIENKQEESNEDNAGVEFIRDRIAEKPEFYPKGVEEMNFYHGLGGSINIGINGLSHRSNSDVLAARSLEREEPLYLNMEPNNPVDKYAIKVMTASGNHIGYVPKKYSELLSYMLECNYAFKCYLANSSYHETPYQYMTISYETSQVVTMERNLMEVFEKLGFEESFIRRTTSVHLIEDDYQRTIDIYIEHHVLDTYQIEETILLNDGEEKKIEYKYNNNIGFYNFSKAQELEKENQIVEAIKLYEMNISIGEYSLKSARRLAVLYKKVNRRNEIKDMYELAHLNIPLWNKKEQDKIKELDENTSYVSEDINSHKRKLKRAKDNIMSAKKAYEKATAENKLTIAKRAKERLEKLQESLPEMERLAAAEERGEFK
ncbi:MAG: HIRAN domain-containing protein [Phocaeicola sp.]